MINMVDQDFIRQRVDDAVTGENEYDTSTRLLTSTVPGDSNDGVFTGLNKASSIAREVQGELNNWIDIIDVRVYGDSVMSICCEYRWTIVRWANSGMEDYMEDNDWSVNPHRLADTHLREENQMEARYMKEVDGMWVYINILVEFPEWVFDELEGNHTIEEKTEKMKRESGKHEQVREMIQRRRNNG